MNFSSLFGRMWLKNSVPALALVTMVASVASAQDLAVTIYNHGQAVVTEVRTMALEKGESRVDFRDVAETIEPRSIRIQSLTSPDRFAVLDMNYEYDLINAKSLLDKYIGKDVLLSLPNPENHDKTSFVHARVVSNNDRPIFMLDDKVYVGSYTSIYFDAIPDELRATPTLAWLVSNQGPTTQDIQVSYVASQIRWETDYVLALDKDGRTASLTGWATIDNKTGKAFKGARLQLMAGELNRARPERDMVAMAQKRTMYAEAAGMSEESVFEYHLYSMPRRLDIANRQTKQISLLQAPGIAIERRLLFTLDNWSGNTPWTNPEVYVEFKNSKANGLGIPVPKGIVRAYQDSADGTSLLIGEDRIDHTPVDAEIKLKMGKAFDLQAESKILESKKVADKVFQYVKEISIRNGKDAAQALSIEDRLPGEWTIERSSHEYARKDSSRIVFDLTVPPSSEKDLTVVTYKVTTRQ
ncbi:MAG: DUF4139 domain-containing protein [Deltaproteobacteria bacterium]|nr:DUF4139 domain-containing protein [Deltaproteobacteria bacterium]